MIKRMLKLQTIIALAFFLLIAFSLISSAQAQVSVVVDKSSTVKASEKEIKDIFSGTKLRWEDGSAIKVVDQPDAKITADFYKKLLNQPVMKVRLQWTKLVLSGQASAPVKCTSDEAVLKILSEDKNAIGFIASSSVNDKVKVLLKLE
ncbi:MAG: hypothetical protein H6696_01500 [Deferribacteres bacterium]|nr:hypothetical protein [candidate division KSB1 bacterium]MCB9500585.1 hypothetical protein [Deferribacteres bacterium]